MGRGLFGDVAKWANRNSNRRAAIVTTPQIGLTAEFYIATNVSFFRMPVWTWPQYVAACDDPAFFESVRENLGWTRASHGEKINADDKRRLMERKFHFAGFSVRWMFAMSTDAVRVAIKCHSRAVPCYAIVHAMLGVPSTELSTSLFVTDDRGYTFFVSRAAMYAVVDAIDIDSRSLRLARSLAAQCRFAGWTFEFGFFMQLRSACESRCPGEQYITVTGADGAPKQWMASRVSQYYHVEDLGSWSSVNYSMGTWYCAARYNQGFDTVMVSSPSSLRFVQLTTAKTCPRRLTHLTRFGQAWEKSSQRQLSRVELVAVVPDANSFHWKKTKTEIKVPWEIEYRTVSFNAALMD